MHNALILALTIRLKVGRPNFPFSERVLVKVGRTPQSLISGLDSREGRIISFFGLDSREA